LPKVHRPNQKVEDEDIIRLNAFGLSLRFIGNLLDCHHTTVKQRLETLGVKPADTRRAFTEDIYNNLNDTQKQWVANQLTNCTIKDLMVNLIQHAARNRTSI